MSHPRLVVFSLDAFSASALGCYGSSWNETPEINALAAAGCLWDRVVATTSCPRQQLESWFGESTDDGDWIRQWRQHGSVELFCDDAQLARSAIAEVFDTVCVVDHEQVGSDAIPAEEIDETRLGGLVAEVMERLQRDEDWSALWIQSDFLLRHWDAPRYLVPLDEEDDLYDDAPSDDVELLSMPGEESLEAFDAVEPLFGSVEPPVLKLDSTEHPDLVTSWMRTYGCQIRLVDIMVGVLRDACQRHGATLVVTGTSGTSLGQSNLVGHHAGQLTSAQLRLPLVVSPGPKIRAPGIRSADVVRQTLLALGTQSAGKATTDEAIVLSPTDWARSDGEFEPHVVSRSAESEAVAISTSTWFLVQDAGNESRLFLKPDDIDDVNDISRLRHDVTEALCQRLDG